MVRVVSEGATSMEKELRRMKRKLLSGSPRQPRRGMSKDNAALVGAINMERALRRMRGKR